MSIRSILSWGRTRLHPLVAATGGFLAVVLLFYALARHTPYASATESPLAANTVKSATDFNWRQTPSAALGHPGKVSVTLDPCPPGVLANEAWYYVYISDGASSEAL